MRLVQTLVIVALLIAVGVAYRQLHHIEVASSHLHQVHSNISAAGTAVTHSQIPLSSVANSATSESTSFLSLVKSEAETMSSLVADPEDIQQRLRELAAKMQESDVSLLQENALNTQLNGDHRFLSVYLLGESTLEIAQKSLEEIASAPIPKLSEARLINQEEILRGQAVESLRKPERLKRVLSHIDNEFITDRAQRNLMYIEGKVSSSPQQQDTEALSRLLKKSSH